MANIKVKKGETISEIAKRYGTTVVALRKLNRLKSADKIKVGQTINIGQASGTRTNPPDPYSQYKKLHKDKKKTPKDKPTPAEKNQAKMPTKSKLSTGGALKKTTPAQKGLQKLPTAVRNKMGYMHNGGSPSKGKKGVMVISIGVGKMKKKPMTKKKK